MYGQIYIPVVNWLLMIATVATTIAFGSSDRLAGAYGTAVSTTMLLTTVLLYRAMRHVWRWPIAAAIAVAGIFLIVDGSFFLANLVKIAEGGWLPLSFAAVLFVIMTTWRTGTDAIRATLVQPTEAGERFLSDLKRGIIPRVEGTTVFLTRSTQKVSGLIMAHVHFAGVLPKHAIALSVLFEATPRIAGAHCSVVDQVAEGLWHVVARFGFFEIPDLRRALRDARGLDEAVDFDKALFVGTRDLIVQKRKGASLRGWRLMLFAFLYRNSVKVVDRFSLAPENVIEIARQIAI
ncbi:MAG TPA: KUP/HAK/KT family potassium transporter, partial [Steroidobacteraceae bacterium]|nr:KUP/HAK/KT family potassium transporter [Steroidobacteraceae bacterium]